MTEDYPFLSVVDATYDDVLFTVTIVLADLRTGAYLIVSGSSGFQQR
jgi:hypothetical protein